MRRKVKRIIDGNTFEVYRKVSGTKLIRLAGLEVPSTNVHDSKAATSKLSKLIIGKTVTLFPKGRRYSKIT